jgi:hypothetical protein
MGPIGSVDISNIFPASSVWSLFLLFLLKITFYTVLRLLPRNKKQRYIIRGRMDPICNVDITNILPASSVWSRFLLFLLK